MTGPLVVLVGPMGVGKSTVGELLAARLGTTYRDTDADVVAEAGKPIAEIFYDEGEDHFRALERRAVAAALTGHAGVLSSAAEPSWTRRPGSCWRTARSSISPWTWRRPSAASAWAPPARCSRSTRAGSGAS